MQLNTLTTVGLIAVVVKGYTIPLQPEVECTLDKKTETKFEINGARWPFDFKKFSVDKRLSEELKKCKAPNLNYKFDNHWWDWSFSATGEITKGDKKCVEQAISVTYNAGRATWNNRQLPELKKSPECIVSNGTSHHGHHGHWNGTQVASSVVSYIAQGTGLPNPAQISSVVSDIGSAVSGVFPTGVSSFINNHFPTERPTNDTPDYSSVTIQTKPNSAATATATLVASSTPSGTPKDNNTGGTKPTKVLTEVADATSAIEAALGTNTSLPDVAASAIAGIV